MPARLKLNLFSPLPPVRSEIANHTLTVAAALQEVADVTLWTPQTEPPVLRTLRGRTLDLPVVQFDPVLMDLPRMNQADAHIYNIGNNADFHRAIFNVARQAPGLVVVHDTRLQHFFARYAEFDDGNRAFYLDCLKRCHGVPAVDDAKLWLTGEQRFDVLVERYPMTAAAAEVALAAIVHNPAELPALAAATRTPVFHLPLVHDAGAPPERPMGGPELRLIVFGFIGPNRRLGAILDALAACEDTGLRLDIYGAIDDPAPVEDRIKALGLGDQVQLHGFVDEAELRAALARADLALNLRYPSMGEASASQLRIWEWGLASVVTRTGWYATLPDDAVFFVEPEREVESLREHLAALRRDPLRFRSTGLRGRQVLEQAHAPAVYAAGLLHIVSQINVLHARRTATDLSRRAAQILLELTQVEALPLCAGAVAEAVAGLHRTPEP